MIGNVIGDQMDGKTGGNRKFGSGVVSTVFAVLAVVLLLAAGARPAVGQNLPCSPNWTDPATVWAAEGSIKVMLNNQPTSNRPTIPTFLYNSNGGGLDDGNFDPWGYPAHPQPLPELNPVWSCSSAGSPTITLAGAGRETISFQIFITAGTALSNVSVDISPLGGAGTLTADNTQTSDITRYLEGYIPYSYPTAAEVENTSLSASGSMPDPLIPFYDPYDPGTPAVGTPFNVQAGTTQGVWVNISIPAGQTAGTYTGTVTVTGNGVSESIPVTLTVWNGTLPRFDSGSVNPAHADMLKAWMPMEFERFGAGEGMACWNVNACQPNQSNNFLVKKYQVMAHDYDFDTFMDMTALVMGPNINGAYPNSSPTSFTIGACHPTSCVDPSNPSTTGFAGTASTIDWTLYDAYYGPSLTPGGLFADGTNLRVFDSPAGNGGGEAAWWSWGYCWDALNGPACGYTATNNFPPAGLLQLYTNLSEQVSQHFTQNQLPVSQGGKGWGHPELIAYTWDEPPGHAVISTPLTYQDIALYTQAMNQANSSLPGNSATNWAVGSNPIHSFLTDMPACMRTEDTHGNSEDGNDEYYAPVCQDHINLSFPGGTNASSDVETGNPFKQSWVIDWSPNPQFYMPGRPGSDLWYNSMANPASYTAGTGYEYTLDMTQGVPAQSSAPVPIEKWYYQGGAEFAPSDGPDNTGVGLRANFWIAYKYGLDQTVPTAGMIAAGVTNPPPAPGGVWIWNAAFWGDQGGGDATPGNCTQGSSPPGALPNPSPYLTGPWGQGGVMFYPGNELGCYYTANPTGASILTTTPAVNTNCVADTNGGGYGEGYAICNGISGPVASIRMEQWRRGYEDYEYLYLLGKQSGRSAAMAIVNSMGGGGMTSGGLGNGTTPTTGTPVTGWQALDWENLSPPWNIHGVWSLSGGGGVCTDNNPNSGGSGISLPNGPTGTWSGGEHECPGEWTNNPDRYAAARVQMAIDLGWTAPSTAPTITGLSPTSGPAAGGTPVTITGTNFTSGATVQFGGVNATSVTFVSSTSMIATSPGGTGTVDVQVMEAGGTSAPTSVDQFTYVSPVTVTGVSPNSGPVAGGQTVTIIGTAFSAGAVVDFGGVAATGVNVTSPTSLTATSPAGSGTVDVTVTTSQGTSAINPKDQYNYNYLPWEASVIPATGSTTSSTTVIVTGGGFSSGDAVTLYGPSYYGAPGDYNTGIVATYLSPTQMEAVMPPCDKYPTPYLPCGTLAPAGTTISVGGYGALPFYFTVGAATTTTLQVSPSSSSSYGTPITLTAKVSSAAGTPSGTVKFYNNGTTLLGSATLSGGTATFTPTTPLPVGSELLMACYVATPPTYTASASIPETPYTITGAPTTTKLTASPTSGNSGTSVTLTATVTSSVGTPTGTVTFLNNGTPIGTVPSNGSGVATFTTTALPPGTDSITANYPTQGNYIASTSPVVAVIIAAPTITSISPSIGFNGTSVTITGTNFLGATAVKFGGIAATSFTVDSDTQITAIAPADSGKVSVTVTTPSGIATAPVLFTYSTALPTTTSITPPGGFSGNTVTITGTNFFLGATVKFGAYTATGVVVNSAASITATVPAGPAGGSVVAVIVSTGNGPSPSGVQFTYSALPNVISVSPVGGVNTGGTTVTITGMNLTGATAVHFGGTAVTPISSTATTVTVKSPAYSGTVPVTVPVTVTTPNGISAINSASQFTYVAAPTVASVSGNGWPGGGQTVTITGMNFTGATAVDFGPGNPGTNILVNSAGTQILVTSPQEPSTGCGKVAVTVTTLGGTSTGILSAANTFNYGCGPVITSISPASGPYVGGNKVVITGINFSTSPNTMSVKTYGNGSNADSFVVNSTKQITAFIGPSSPVGYTGSSAVYVSDGAGGSNGEPYTYTAMTTQTITFPTIPSKVYGNPPFTVTATSSSGLPVTIAVTSGPATISGNTVTLTGAGTVTLTATQAGNANYSAAPPVTQSFTVTAPIPTLAPTTTTLTVSPSPSAAYGAPVTLTATVSSGSGTPTGTVNFTWNGGSSGPIPVNPNTGVATFTPTTPLPVGSPDTLTATYGGNSSYEASSGTATETISYAPYFTLTVPSTSATVTIAPPKTTGSATLTLTSHGDYGGTLKLSCTNLPANAYCVFPGNSGAQSQQVQLSSSNTLQNPLNVPVTIEINTATAPPLARMQWMPNPLGPQQSPLSPILPALAFWWPGSMAGLATFGRKRNLSKAQQRMLQLCLLVLMTGALAAGISGCAGGTYGTTTPAAVGVTPSGTTTVTVTATPVLGSGYTAQSAQITLVVQ